MVRRCLQAERNKADLEIKMVNLQTTASQKDKAAIAASHREAAAANQVQELMLRYQGALQELAAANAATAAAHAAAQTAERQGMQLQQKLALSENRWCAAVAAEPAARVSRKRAWNHLCGCRRIVKAQRAVDTHTRSVVAYAGQSGVDACA